MNNSSNNNDRSSNNKSVPDWAPTITYSAIDLCSSNNNYISYQFTKISYCNMAQESLCYNEINFNICAARCTIQLFLPH